MTLFRCRLRLLVAAWLMFQAATLSAFVPRACCLVHQGALTKQDPDCHTPPASAESSVPVESPAPHHGHEHHVAQHAPAPQPAPPADDCALRGTCSGPAAALLAALSTQGILPQPAAAILAPVSAPVKATEERHAISCPTPPDPPPPRA
jgi:hypothetical protein